MMFESAWFWDLILLAYVTIGGAGYSVLRNEYSGQSIRVQAAVNILATCVGIVGFAFHLSSIFFAGWILIAIGGIVVSIIARSGGSGVRA
jgi:hypothetical protein